MSFKLTQREYDLLREFISIGVEFMPKFKEQEEENPISKGLDKMVDIGYKAISNPNTPEDVKIELRKKLDIIIHQRDVSRKLKKEQDDMMIKDVESILAKLLIHKDELIELPIDPATEAHNIINK